MMTRRTVATVAMLASLLLAGCSGTPTPEVHRYLLDDAAVGAPGAGAGVLRIARVDVAAHLDGIVIRRPGNSVDTLVYHAWAAPLGDMTARALRKSLLERGEFRDVYLPGDRAPPAAEVDVRLSHLEVVERPGQALHATAGLELVGVSSDDPARARYARFTCTADAAVSGPDVPSMVEALGQALRAASDQAAELLSALRFP